MAGRDGALPPFLQRENRHAAHQPILIVQALIFTLMSTFYLAFDDVQVAFWLMNIVPTMLYIIMYILMFMAAVRLRYTQAEVPRRYRVPFGIVGIWGLAILGSLAGLTAIVFAFIPPALVEEADRASYKNVVLIGLVFFTVLPFVDLSMPTATVAQPLVILPDPMTLRFLEPLT